MKAKILSTLFLCLVSTITRAQETEVVSLTVGDAAPTVKLKPIKGSPAQQFEIGKVYVVEFWATWCLPCIAGMPHLSKLANEYKDKVTVTGVSVMERKITSFARITRFVDSMGMTMDYNVAAEDSNYMTENWLKVAGERGIPVAFIIDQSGKIAWIGHPKYLDEVLPEIVRGNWNITEAAKKRKESKELAKIDNDVIPLLNRYMGNPGKPDSALIEIDKLVANHPGLKYAPRIGHFTLFSLIKKDPLKAYEYGKKLMTTVTYADPPFKSITDAVSWASEIAKLNLPKEIYELGAEAYKAQIDNYPWSMNLPVTYDKIADLYFKADNKSKAIEAQKKAIEKIKDRSDITEKQTTDFQSRLKKYQDM